ncbi:tyrosine-type recombinase/integrase [Microbacterium gilvum]|uniref:Site-specific integrase n=1 Tax=Microbacterium gilvum TaxID=1336204 RepID=A0ABP8ZQP0_9MICO
MAGAVKSYETASGRRWEVRYRKPDGAQTRKRGFKTKRDAETYAAGVVVSKATGDYVDPARGRITIGELSTAWLRKKSGLKPSSYHSIEVAWTVHVEPRWGHIAVKDVTASAVETWIQDMVEGVAPVTRKRETKQTTGGRSASVVLRALGVLAGILDDAQRDRRIHRNPARGLENLPRKTAKKDRRYLSDAEAAAFAKAVADPVRGPLVIFLAYTGLRWGEAVGLRVRDLNTVRRRVHVRQNAVEVDGEIEIGEPKTWERRSVPYPAFLATTLRGLAKGKGPDAYLFAGDLGGVIRRPKTDEDSGSWFRAAQTAAGIERLTIHDLRHTAASLAISAGAHVKAVQRMLGHKSAAMTLDTYADLFEDDLDDVAVRMDERGREAAAVALASLAA